MCAVLFAAFFIDESVTRMIGLADVELSVAAIQIGSPT